MRKCPQSIQTQPTPCHPFTAIVGAEGHNWYIFGYFRSLLAPRATWKAIPGEKIVPTFRPAHTLTYLTLCQPVPSNKNYFDCVYGHGAHFVKRSKSIPEIKAFVLPKYSSDVVLSIIKFTFCFLSCINQFPSLLLNPLSWLWAPFFWKELSDGFCNWALKETITTLNCPEIYCKIYYLSKICRFAFLWMSLIVVSAFGKW